MIRGYCWMINDRTTKCSYNRLTRFTVWVVLSLEETRGPSLLGRDVEWSILLTGDSAKEGMPYACGRPHVLGAHGHGYASRARSRVGLHHTTPHHSSASPRESSLFCVSPNCLSLSNWISDSLVRIISFHFCFLHTSLKLK